MRNKSGAIPFFVWPFFLLLAAVSILLLSVSEPELKVAAPLPPQLYSSSYQLIGTGNKLGTYYPVGHILADWFNSNLGNGEKIFKAVETNGSIDNIRLLNEKKITLAFAESRIVKEAYAESATSSLRLVWPLWPDVVQLVKSPKSARKKLSELSYGFLGQKNSSTFRTSCEIFKALGIDPAKVGIELAPDRVLSDLVADRIEFAMIQAGIPNRTVSDAVIFHNCTLTDFSGEDYKLLQDKVSTSWKMVIPAGYYGERQPEILTLGIPNVLVANEDVSSATIELITDLMSRSARSLKIRHQAFADIPASPQEARKFMDGIGVPIHQGTLNWLAREQMKAVASDTSID
ncbi:MAG: TAXI family TRAP transporter solute-binding subunit [Candidatus Rifleibacteriota bacterium]